IELAGGETTLSHEMIGKLTNKGLAEILSGILNLQEELGHQQEQLEESSNDLQANLKSLQETNAKLDNAQRAYLSMMEDLEAQKKELDFSLNEKEILLQEVHHRVKNNMQIISSLLNLQSRQIKDKDALRMYNDSQARIRSMALVHEQLYQSNDFSKLEFDKYLHTLSNNLMSSYTLSANIDLNIDVTEVNLDLDRAVPTGLIVNELMTNSFKYAFHEKEFGEININMSLSNDEKITLVYSDNGIGIPTEIDWQKTDSLGLTLVRTLTRQLNGTIELDTSKDTQFTLVF
ncbi:MAG: sensor histidine kinase, partial [Bacteroidia bacterium]|nr:sensor histidine kinase [Bacteroidia bacterium]